MKERTSEQEAQLIKSKDWIQGMQEKGEKVKINDNLHILFLSVYENYSSNHHYEV